MDIRKVKKLIELLEESGISELEISEGEESVRISRHPRMAMQAPMAAPVQMTAAPQVAAPATPASPRTLMDTATAHTRARRRPARDTHPPTGRTTVVGRKRPLRTVRPEKRG